ncbi:hypothetical protein [Methanobacterium sp. ACI-7]|uniref:hypothetical protein n=1 Tax=unclassified Methanobacterium TaxID=2627676 RepID=UPI0039C13297
MKTKFNYFWGLLGILGLLGYVLENPIYYVFFAFFALFLIPVFNKNTNKEKNVSNDYNMYKIGIWLGSALLIVNSLFLMVYKTMNDFVAAGLLFGIIVFVGYFFAYLGMEKTAKDERLRKIGTLAATWSWYITLVFLSFLVINMHWAQRIHDPIELMGLTIFVMVTTMLIANTILSRRGDIE